MVAAVPPITLAVRRLDPTVWGYDPAVDVPCTTCDGEDPTCPACKGSGKVPAEGGR